MVSPALETEIKSGVKTAEAGILLKPKEESETKRLKTDEPSISLKPKQEMVSKSAAQIVHEQHRKYVLVSIQLPMSDISC